MTNQKFFERKSVVATFGILALLGGFYFLNESYLTGKVTGNYVSSGSGLFDFFPILGFLLILCSAVLIIYSIVRKE
ncbi:MAG: hypothetical protein AABW63_02735 [Nanoarchaeota archaeon]